MENVALQEKTQTHREKLEALKIFIGKWKIGGNNFSSVQDDAGTPVNGEDHYEWIEGNFFIIGRWQHLTGGKGDHLGVSILGYDTEAEQYFTRNFDNLGFEREYILTPDGNTWKFSGEKERAIRKFSNDGNAYNEHWEVRSTQGRWIPLCIMSARKIL